MPRCPECFRPIDLRPIWKIAGGGYFNFIGSGCGVTCANCDTRSQIRQWRSRLVVALYYGAAIPALVIMAICMNYFETLSRLQFGLASAVLLMALGLVQHRFVAPMATLRKALPDQRLNYPLEWNTKHISKVDVADAFKTRPHSKPWKCRCGEQNPSEFDLCWKCKRELSRNGA
jgi:hypothetical protein